MWGLLYPGSKTLSEQLGRDTLTMPHIGETQRAHRVMSLAAHAANEMQTPSESKAVQPLDVIVARRQRLGADERTNAKSRATPDEESLCNRRRIIIFMPPTSIAPTRWSSLMSR
jgi:hypothetical protein